MRRSWSGLTCMTMTSRRIRLASVRMSAGASVWHVADGQCRCRLDAGMYPIGQGGSRCAQRYSVMRLDHLSFADAVRLLCPGLHRADSLHRRRGVSDACHRVLDRTPRLLQRAPPRRAEEGAAACPDGCWSGERSGCRVRHRAWRTVRPIRDFRVIVTRLA